MEKTGIIMKLSSSSSPFIQDDLIYKLMELVKYNHQNADENVIDQDSTSLDVSHSGENEGDSL